MRFEIPALIVVEAHSPAEARKKALDLSGTLRKDIGPGAFFCDIGVAPTGLGRSCEADREEETVDAHVRSILAVSPVAFIQP